MGLKIAVGQLKPYAMTELEMLEQALLDFQEAYREHPYRHQLKSTYYKTGAMMGFCSYFKRIHNTNIPMPLKKYKPKSLVGEYWTLPNYFGQVYIAQRIKLLEAAIDDLKTIQP